MDETSVSSFCILCKETQVKDEAWDSVFGLNCNKCYKLRSNKKKSEWLAHKKRILSSCSFCWNAYCQNRPVLLHHCRRDGIFTCSICKKLYDSEKSMEDHVMIAHSKPMQLEKCDNCSKSIPKLSSHKCIETHRKPFQCEICKTKFSTLNVWQCHVKTHTGSKTLECLGSIDPNLRIEDDELGSFFGQEIENIEESKVTKSCPSEDESDPEDVNIFYNIMGEKRGVYNKSAKRLKEDSSTKQRQCELMKKKYLVSISSGILAGRNGFVWNTKPVKQRAKCSVNKVQPAPPSFLEYTMDPLDCFRLFFSDRMLEKILEHTNEELKRQQVRYKNQNDTSISDVTREELNALFGLLVLGGALRNNHLSSDLLFDGRYCGSNYRSTMSSSRFKHLLNSLRFDPLEKRSLKGNKLLPIKDIWEMLLENCRNHYIPGSYVTIDEHCHKVYHSCLPPLQDKHGLHIIMMCDNVSKYMIDAEPFLGRGTTPTDVSRDEYFIRKLINTIKGTEVRNVTVNKLFITVPMVQELLMENLTVVGKVKKSAPELPKEFIDINFKKRKIGSSMFLHHKDFTVVSYLNKENELTNVISSLHHDESVHYITGKPDLISYFKETKSTVGMFDQICRTTTCSRLSKWWPLRFFYIMMNIAHINSYVIYVHNFTNRHTEKPLNRQQFLLLLHQQLADSWRRQRLRVNCISRDLKDTIHQTLNGPSAEGTSYVPPESTEACIDPVTQRGPRKTCCYCSSTKKRMTTIYCRCCKKAICGEHQKKVCFNCDNQLQVMQDFHEKTFSNFILSD